MAVAKTSTKPNPGSVVVKTSAGEYLKFTVTDQGPGPSFTMASSTGVIFSPPVAKPQASYEWFRFKDPADPTGFDVLVLIFIFLTNANYTYKVELWNAAGLQSTILDIAYQGAPTDHCAEDLTVVTA
jgi:hypothetical protein